MTRLLVLTALAFTAIHPAMADVLLVVDITNPANTTITATSGLASVSSSALDYGVFLEGLTSAVANRQFAVVGNLQTANAGLSYNLAFENFGSGLEIKQLFGGSTETFVQGSLAFSGSGTLDLTGGASLSNPGIYDIVVSDNFGSPTSVVIGQYQLVSQTPEPSTAALFALAGLLFLITRRPGTRAAATPI